MAAALIVAVVLGLIALGGITGGTSARVTPSRVFALGIPLFIISGATLLPFGITWWSALLMAVLTIVGMVLAKYVGPLLDATTQRAADSGRWGAAAAVAVGRSTVVVVLAAIVVRWGAPLANAMTNLSSAVIAVVCLSAAVTAAIFARGRLGLARTAFIASIVVAVLVLVIGVVTGTPARSFDPIVPVVGPTTGGLILAIIATLVAGAVHPGLSSWAKESSSAVIRGAVFTGLIGLAVLLGVIWFGGGSVQFPSLPSAVVSGYIAFAPSIVGALLAGLVVAVITVAASVTLETVLAGWDDFGDASLGGWLGHRWVAIVAAGIGAVILCLVPLTAGWLLGTVAVIGIVAVVLSRRAGRAIKESAEAAEEDSSGPVSEEATAR